MENLNNKIKENEIWNQDFKTNFLLCKKINSSVLVEFNGMYEYGAASTINWLISKLKLIRFVLDKQEEVTIEEDPIIILKTHDDLKNWIAIRFDESIIEDVYRE